MKSLFRELKEYKKECILAPLFKMLEALFDLFVPLVVKNMIDVGIRDQSTGYIIGMCALLIGLALIGLLCSFVAQYFAAGAATGFSAKLRSMVFSHVQGLSFSNLDEVGQSTLITRMTSDINQIQSGVNLTLRLFMRSPFIVFGAMIMAFTLDIRAALIFVVVIPLLSIVVFGIILMTMPMYKRVQDHLDNVTGKTRENLTGVRVIRAFTREESESEAFLAANETLKKYQIFVGRISAFLNPVTYAMLNIAIVVLLYVGGVQVSVGLMTTGTVVALVNYMNQILVELVKLANLIITMTRAYACGNRVAAVLAVGGEKGSGEKKEETKVTENVTEGVRESARTAGRDGTEDRSGKAGKIGTVDKVCFSHVSMSYSTSGSESLTDIDFSVKPGETIGIIGGTGSGKSSLAMMIPGFYPASKGTVSVDGKDVRSYDHKELRDKVGIVMQKAAMFSGTIRDNILMGRDDATDEEVWDALSKAQAAEFVREKKGGLDAPVEQDGRNFSGGQKQRLSVARALLKHPEILILDDSASALDFATDAALRKEIRNMKPDMTIFIISQRTGSVMNADRIIVMEDGEIAGLGSHEELMKTCEVYQEIYNSQWS